MACDPCSVTRGPRGATSLRAQASVFSVLSFVPSFSYELLVDNCNSYRKLVSSCIECNSQKGEKPADDFLRRLYREGHLNAAELADRLRALDDLAAARLRPSLTN